MHPGKLIEKQLYAAEQVRAIDRYAIDRLGVPGIVLMKRAAQALLSRAQQCWPDVERLVVFCGGGNNGGDGYLFAGLAKARQLNVVLVAGSDPERLRGDARLAMDFAVQSGVTIVPAANRPELTESDLVVDALLGTGLQDEVRADTAQLIRAINESPAAVLAADIPSGLNSDTGQIMGLAVQAEQTVTFVGLKAGLLTGAGRACCGEIVFAGLGIDAAAYQQPARARLLDWPELQASLPRRAADAHKGRHGHVLIIGGDSGLGGAVLMAGRAAMRCGAGLVSIATRAEHVSACLATQPELMVRAVDGMNDLQPLLQSASCIVIGPGLGQSSWGEQLLYCVLREAGDRPLVVDADALNLLAARRWTDRLGQLNAVCTPHPGEAARLLNTRTNTIQYDRFAAVAELATKLSACVLLKGSGTLIAGAGETTLCPYGNPGMASGGMGDVLSGVIAALCAQGLTVQQAAQVGACAHAIAADRLAAEFGPLGMAATDLIAVIRGLLNGLEGEVKAVMTEYQSVAGHDD